jgi:hypothetical protein
MTMHSCSYYCDKPECIKSQRDELRETLSGVLEQNTELDAKLAEMERQWPFPPPGFKHPRPGDRVLGLDDYEDALL